MKPWQYGAELLTGFVLYALAACVSALFRKLRGRPWKASFRKSFRSMGIAFLLAALGTLAHIGQHNVLALAPVRILCIVLAAVFWFISILWFVRIWRRIPQAAQNDSESDRLLQLTGNKWIFVSLILAAILTATAAFS